MVGNCLICFTFFGVAISYELQRCGRVRWSGAPSVLVLQVQWCRVRTLLRWFVCHVYDPLVDIDYRIMLENCHGKRGGSHFRCSLGPFLHTLRPATREELWTSPSFLPCKVMPVDGTLGMGPQSFTRCPGWSTWCGHRRSSIRGPKNTVFFWGSGAMVFGPLTCTKVAMRSPGQAQLQDSHMANFSRMPKPWSSCGEGIIPIQRW